jgi:hypothetical protein
MSKKTLSRLGFARISIRRYPAEMLRINRTFRIADFGDFVYFWKSKNVENKTLGKKDLLPSSGEER